ncbi:MAG: hypothetical protein ACRDHM_00935 [Actinomycetota bacterium]
MARWLAAGLSMFEAGFMLIDGARALITGEYISPKSGKYAGKLGPWAVLVRRIGVDPEGVAMKRTFVAYGVVWLGVSVGFLAGFEWAWAAMLFAAVGSLWYLVVGTITSLVVIVLLFLPGARV